jgi:hypothetical protein
MQPEEKQIVVVQSPHRRSDVRQGGLLLSGGIAGLIGGLAGSVYANTIGKMLEFNSEVANRTREDISKMGLGAGMGSMGSFDGATRGIIEEKHALDLIKDPKYRFAKFNRIIGGNFTLVTAGIAAVIGAGAYLLSSKSKQPETHVLESMPRIHTHQINTELADGKKWAETVQQERKTEPAVSV